MSIGILLLAIYLILVGITGVGGPFGIPPIVLSVLAIISGIFLLLGR